MQLGVASGNIDTGVVVKPSILSFQDRQNAYPHLPLLPNAA